MIWGGVIDEQLNFAPFRQQDSQIESAPLFPHGVYKFKENSFDDDPKWVILRHGTFARYSFCRLSYHDYWCAGYEPHARHLPDVRQVLEENAAFDEVLSEPDCEEINLILKESKNRLDKAKLYVADHIDISKKIKMSYEDLLLSNWTDDVLMDRIKLRESEYEIFKSFVDSRTS